MWTTKNHKRYDRDRLRYPSDLTDEEWSLVAPLIPRAKSGGNKRTVNLREVMNGIMYVLGTGCQWRAIPKDLPPRSTLSAISICGATMARLIVSITPCSWRAESKASATPARLPPSSIARA